GRAKASTPTSVSACRARASSRSRRFLSTACARSRSRASASPKNSRRSSSRMSSAITARRRTARHTLATLGATAMTKKRLAAVRGMNDLLPADAPLWEWFEARVAEWLAAYGYQRIQTPVLEHTELFVRGIGEVTDIVEKEMYSFEDRLNSEQLTLRPEFPAGVRRAASEHHLTYDPPRRVWSSGPVFRHERPQRGRYRQFHQVNVEGLGFEGPDIDAEHIVMLARLWRLLELGPVRLELNCLGQADERLRHRADL